MGVKISELPFATEVLENDVSPTVQNGTTKKATMAVLGNYILNVFNSLSLGGVARTVKSAIDSISTSLSSLTAKVGNTTMGTEATTVTGAIAEHEDDITTLNSNMNSLLVHHTVKVTNVTINAGGSAEVVGNYPTLSGYTFRCILNVRVDGVDTTDPINVTYCTVPNFWPITTTQEVHCVVRNLWTGYQAKLSVNFLCLYTRNS